MLPGKASRLPRPRRLRSRLARKATTTPYPGPSSTAHSTLTMCCTGAHWLPNTGNWSMLPTTATAHEHAGQGQLFEHEMRRFVHKK